MEKQPIKAESKPDDIVSEKREVVDRLEIDKKIVGLKLPELVGIYPGSGHGEGSKKPLDVPIGEYIESKFGGNLVAPPREYLEMLNNDISSAPDFLKSGEWFWIIPRDTSGMMGEKAPIIFRFQDGKFDSTLADLPIENQDTLLLVNK